MYGDIGSIADVFSIDFTLQHKIENESHQEICLEQVRCSTVATSWTIRSSNSGGCNRHSPHPYRMGLGPFRLL